MKKDPITFHISNGISSRGLKLYQIQTPVQTPLTAIYSKGFMFIGMTSRFTKGRLYHRLFHYHLQQRPEVLLKADSGRLRHCHFLSSFHVYSKALKL